MKRDESDVGVKVYFEAVGGRIFCASISPKGLINDIETLYPRDFERLLKTIARFKGKSKDLLDVDTPRAVEMLSRRSDTTLPKATATALNDAISVLKNFESVNGSGMVDQTASRQFKEWFGKSKVVEIWGRTQKTLGFLVIFGFCEASAAVAAHKRRGGRKRGHFLMVLRGCRVQSRRSLLQPRRERQG